MLTRRAKIGKNRGKARLWLEGQWLADNGFPVGTKFRADIVRSRSTFETHIDLVATPNGERTVSGKGTKPIIDINSDVLLNVAPAGSYLTLKITQGEIVGRIEHESEKIAA